MILDFDKFKDKTLNEVLKNIKSESFTIGTLSLGLNDEKTGFIVVDFIQFDSSDITYVCKN